jgi:hypothetical protein
MHEVIITRGKAQGWDFEKQIQIYVPWNVVLVHEGICHRTAQWSEKGKNECILDISQYFHRLTILNWLKSLEADEEYRLIENVKGWK